MTFAAVKHLKKNDEATKDAQSDLQSDAQSVATVHAMKDHQMDFASENIRNE